MYVMAKAEVREIQFDNIGEQAVQLQVFETQGWSVLENYFKNDKPCSRIIKYISISVPLNVRMALTDSVSKNKDVSSVVITNTSVTVYKGQISALLGNSTTTLLDRKSVV